jgi:hypothetical protein
MAERTIHVFAELNTLGEHHMLDLAIELGCNWNSHSDGGEAWLGNALRHLEGAPVRFLLQIDGPPVDGSLHFKDEGQACYLVACDGGMMRKEPVPRHGPLSGFILGFVSGGTDRGREVLSDLRVSEGLPA